MTAYGDNPAYHAIKDERFVCTAPDDAPCRTSPTCDCEQWCCCDGSEQDALDTHDGEGLDEIHCCMLNTKPGQPCWIEPWVSAGDLEDSGDGQQQFGDGGEVTWPDGPVTCEWDEGIYWSYADTTPADLGGRA